MIFRNCLLQSSQWSALLYVWEKSCTWVLGVKYPTSGLIFVRRLKACVHTKKDEGMSRIFMIQLFEPPLTATSLQRPPFFFGRQSMHSLLFQPLYNGHLSTLVTFFGPHGGHCGEVQLFTIAERILACWLVESYGLWEYRRGNDVTV